MNNKTEQDQVELYGLKEAMKVTGLGRSAWLERVRDGIAPKPIKIGRRTLWVKSEVHEWIEKLIKTHREGAKT